MYSTYFPLCINLSLRVYLAVLEGDDLCRWHSEILLCGHYFYFILEASFSLNWPLSGYIFQIDILSLSELYVRSC